MSYRIFYTSRNNQKLYVMVEGGTVRLSPYPYISGAYYSSSFHNGGREVFHFPDYINELVDAYRKNPNYAGMSLYEYMFKALDGSNVDEQGRRVV